MASETASTAEDRALDALTRILDSAITPDALEAQRLILRRLALSGDLFPSRVPAPLNITEVGGYLNLIERDPILRAQVLASALGVAGPNPAPGWEPVYPPLHLVARPNDRPSTVAPATPVSVQIRADFVAAFDTMMSAVHDAGCTLPILSAARPLPPATPGATPPDDLLAHLGRVLELVPSAALVDPAIDPLAVGQAGGAGPNLVVARRLDATAPGAGSVAAAAWSLWGCTGSACSQSTVTDAFLELEPVLNGAGWYGESPLAPPTSLAAPGGWNRWTNLTGLVAGSSTVRSELELIHSTGAIAASSVRERLDWVWDGAGFVAPV
jgi:hypothetical protein